MARADTIAKLHYRTLRIERGETIHYIRSGDTEPIEMEIVAGGVEIIGQESGGVEISARVYGWIALGEELRELLGRLPEGGDLILRDAIELAANETGGERHRVMLNDEGRAWVPHGRHGGLVRFRTTLLPD